MKRTELMRKLRRLARQHGVEFSVTEGRSHTKVRLGVRFVIVPRHTEINELTARGILNDAKGE